MLSLFCLFLLLPFESLLAQDAGSDDRTGVYRSKQDSALEFRISRQGARLLLQILGQGGTELTPLSGERHSLKQVRPAATLEFIRNDSGHIGGCRVQQNEPAYTWKRIESGGNPPG